MRTFAKLGSIAALALSLGACTVGGDDDGSSEPINTPDAAPTADAGPEACTTPVTGFGDVGTVAEADSAAGFATSGSAQIAIYQAGVGEDDLVRIELWPLAGGPLADGFTPGTYPITGVETNYETCSICVFLIGNPDGEGVGEDHFAQSGTFVLTEVGEAGTGRFRATLTDVEFAHVTIGDGGATTVIDDECTSSISNLVADSPIE